MTERHFYATHNVNADTFKRVNYDIPISEHEAVKDAWAVSRFGSREARDAFCENYKNQWAVVVTREEAEEIFRENYLCVGEPVPPGGLFGLDQFGRSNFFNEMDID